MSLKMELHEERRRLSVYVKSDSGHEDLAIIHISTATDAVPITPWERRLGRMIEQAGTMYELTQMIAAFGGRYNDVTDQCRLLGGVWREAYLEGGRSAVHNLMIYLANQVLGRVAAGGGE